MAIKRKTAPAQAQAQAEEEGRQTAPSKGLSFADKFRKVEASGGFMAVGQHTCYLLNIDIDAGAINSDGSIDTPLKVKVTYEGVEEESEGVAGKKISQWYTIADDDLMPHQGAGFLKRDLDVLGYADYEITDLEQIFEELNTKKVRVVINVKQNGQYTNAYLQGVDEGGE